MPKQTIVAEEIGGSYSTTTVHATSAAGLVFVTGQVANRPDSSPAGDPLAQVELGGLEEQIQPEPRPKRSLRGKQA